jgi:prophage regulatory protein
MSSGPESPAGTEMNSDKPMRFLRWPEVERRAGLGQTRIYELEKHGRFPKRIKISDRAVAWLESEIDEWLEARAAAKAAMGDNYQKTAAVDSKASQRPADTESLRANQGEASKVVFETALFLTDAELEFMTGYKQPAAQIRWLQRWGIRHVVNAFGYPRVTRAAVEGTEETGLQRPRATPNFEALDNWKTGTHRRHRRRRQEMGIPEPSTESKGPRAADGRRKRD